MLGMLCGVIMFIVYNVCKGKQTRRCKILTLHTGASIETPIEFPDIGPE